MKHLLYSYYEGLNFTTAILPNESLYIFINLYL